MDSDCNMEVDYNNDHFQSQMKALTKPAFNFSSYLTPGGNFNTNMRYKQRNKQGSTYYSGYQFKYRFFFIVYWKIQD